MIPRGKKPADPLAGIEQEMLEERASALGRIGRALEVMLDELAALCARIDSSTGAERDRLLVDYKALRSRALEQRWYLAVQREACGVRETAEHLAALYPLPTPTPR